MLLSFHPRGASLHGAVEHDQQFAHNGQLSGFAFSFEELVDLAQSGVVADRRQPRHVTRPRTTARSPWARRLPRRCPRSCLKGVTPTKALIVRWEIAPNFEHPAYKVAAVKLATPHTLAST
jgi:hypothetical protein